MNYTEAMELLQNVSKSGSILGLDSIKALMKQLGNPQDHLQIIHIAGTNGKGSTGTFLSSVLESAGYKIGRFSTPDVFSYEEKFQINHMDISKEKLAHYVTVVEEACLRMVSEQMPHPTVFEMETAIAFLYCMEEKCDIMICEVGMGGETDATNLIKKPLVSVLASISMDHVGFLGDTIEKIANVKAGIIKNGCPVVSTKQQPEAMRVIEQMAAQNEAQLYVSDFREVSQEKATLSENQIAVTIDQQKECITFSLPMEVWIDYQNVFAIKDILNQITLATTASYQIENAMLALKVLEVLKKAGHIVCSWQNVIVGMKNAVWKGRFTKIEDAPEFYIDGAHNEGAVRALAETIKHRFGEKKIVYIMGVFADKDYQTMLQIMLPMADAIVTVTPDNPRALDGEELAREAKRCRAEIDSYCAADPQQAKTLAKQLAGKDGVVVAFGSLSYLKSVVK